MPAPKIQTIAALRKVAWDKEDAHPRDHLFLEGYQPYDKADLFKSLDAHGVWFGPRSFLEHDTRFLQVIPYVVVFDAHGGVYSYGRGPASEESRLANKRSIGFGGHIDIDDIRVTVWHPEEGWTGLVEAAAMRELSEELAIDSKIAWRARTQGLLFCPNSPAGEFHLGVVMGLRMPTGLVPQANPQDIHDLVLIDPREAPPEGLEDWSAAIYPHLASFRFGV